MQAEKSAEAASGLQETKSSEHHDLSIISVRRSLRPRPGGLTVNQGLSPGFCWRWTQLFGSFFSPQSMIYLREQIKTRVKDIFPSLFPHPFRPMPPLQPIRSELRALQVTIDSGNTQYVESQLNHYRTK